MKKISVIVFIIVFAGVGLSSANADWSFTLESSDNLTWDLSFVAGDEGNLINNYFMDFQYDTEELAFSAYTPNYMLYGDLPPVGSVGNETEGYITNVSGAALGTGNGYTAAANEEVLLGTFTFTQVASITDGIADVSFWLESSDFGVKIDEIVYSLVEGYEPLAYVVNAEGQAQISSVPAPAAIWLMASGLIGFAGYRSRKNR